MRTRLTILNCLLAGKLAGNFSKKSTLGETQALRSTSFQWFSHEFPTRKSREFFRRSRQFCERSSGSALRPDQFAPGLACQSFLDSAASNTSEYISPWQKYRLRWTGEACQKPQDRNPRPGLLAAGRLHFRGHAHKDICW